MTIRGLLFAWILGWATLASAATEDRVVALVVAGTDGAERADAVQTQLQAMGAETLRAQAPGNAQLRSILKRFAREAAGARATLVYLDLPAVAFEDRMFILPADAIVDRPTDLFTFGIPIKAFARSSAQSEQGGAVIATVVAPDLDLPANVAAASQAPPPVPGSSPVLVTAPDGYDPLLRALENAAAQDSVEIGALLNAVMAAGAATLSETPPRAAYLKQPEVVATETPVFAPVVAPEDAQSATVETQEELESLEKSLSRSARRTLQRGLRDRGHYRGLVDGIFGPQTRAAIIAFQASRSEKETGVLTRRQLLDLSS